MIKVGDYVTVNENVWLPDNCNTTTKYKVVFVEEEGNDRSVAIDTAFAGWEDSNFGSSKYWWVGLDRIKKHINKNLIGGKLL